jgi:hypothetical protein
MYARQLYLASRLIQSHFGSGFFLKFHLFNRTDSCIRPLLFLLTLGEAALAVTETQDTEDNGKRKGAKYGK